MESIVGVLGKYGGDIIKFIGDAMIVMWPLLNKSQYGNPEYLKYLARKAVQCAVDVQIDLNNKKIMSNITNLSVKVSHHSSHIQIGIGIGKCALLHVGGVFNRAEFFTIGDALTQCMACEGDCTAGG